ncbi:Homeodomain-interacting protein kinase 1 [Dissostichus eleginoides]|uniref:Homeodomain-interacting protein kinase 1 n=1 Tax=Dissostichus eleginoides TaxID=100907 RepID=A0AAD9C6I9_DISEL|nr:Homeodomain-interacting protein kinase 1 [Dissostichus eleginoides]
MSQTFQVEKKDIISSQTANYLVLEFIGEGGFGKVAKCVNLKTSEIIAIKIHKDSEDQVEEVRMLEKIRKLDPEKSNLIRFIDNFFFQDVSCLAFEMLDQSLWDFMMNREKAYTLNEIRPITQQLLVAFKALKSIGVIHSDLKHDNIMLVNHQNQPFRIKLIDFGEAIPTSEVEIGTKKQLLPYRAPEVNLGLPISEAIDMWSLGCIIAEMYFAATLFPDSSKYFIMKVICRMIGQPGDHLLNAGKFSSKYFIRERKNSPEWRFKTPEEYKEGTGVEPDISECALDQYSSLDEAIEDYAEEKGRVELNDRMAFVQLLKRLLNLDANSRITPKQALTHSFVTMDHLEEDLDFSPYVTDAVRWMTICRLDHSDASDVPVNNYETDTSHGVSETENDSNADARPDGFCQDPPITSCRKSSQKEQPMTSIAHNSNLGKSEDLSCSSFVKEAGSFSSICSLDHSDSSDVAKNSETFQVEKEDIISSKSADYRVLDFIGEGGFGKVAKCVNLKTSEIIAIKIHKDSEDQVEEVRMLEKIRKLDPEKNNLIRFIDNFFFRDVSCLAFEMLDQSLWDFMMNREKAYTLNEIRPITQQLLVAFKALKSIGVIHSDLKHDNIMLVNHQNQPFRIKLIDFGEAIPTSEVEIGTKKQLLPYRAPEVNLGLPISEAIDMWSLGCIIAEMYIAATLFPDSSKYFIMKVICRMIGQPGDHLLNAGKFSSKYFIRERKNSPEWRFKTPEEYKEGTGVEPDISECALDQYSSLDEAIEDYAEEKGRVELNDRMAFVQLLKRLLDLDANSRITPEQALTHSFVTMGHLEEDLDFSPYVTDAVRWMTICRLDHSDASDVPVNNYETDSSGGEKDMEISSNADARPDGFCQDPPITYCRKSSQKEQPMTSIAHNSNLEKSNIDTTHNKSTPNSNDGAAATITPTDQGDVDKTRTGLPKRLNVFQRMRRRVVSFFRRFKK